jgi:hypothetical protein
LKDLFNLKIEKKKKKFGPELGENDNGGSERGKAEAGRVRFGLSL